MVRGPVIVLINCKDVNKIDISNPFLEFTNKFKVRILKIKFKFLFKTPIIISKLNCFLIIDISSFLLISILFINSSSKLSNFKFFKTVNTYVTIFILLSL